MTDSLVVPAGDVRPGDTLVADDGRPIQRDPWKARVREVRLQAVIVFDDYRQLVYPADHELNVKRP